MKPLYLGVNETRTAFKANSDYTKAQLTEWLKKYHSFEVKPVMSDTKKGRRYLEGAVIPAYCKWQYDIDPRQRGCDEARRTLFKRDFNYEVVANRAGEPVRIPLSSQGKVKELTDKYTAWAMENGAPVPNPDLYKLYRDKWSQDPRFDCYHDWLAFLGLEEDAMPSAETLAVLEEPKVDYQYPDVDLTPKF
jgi:hypothetical protein